MPYRPMPLHAPILVVGAVLVASPAFAAQDGLISTTASEGALDITLSVPPLVRISDLDDLALGEFQGAGLSGSDDVCIWSTTRAYTVRAQGDGSGGAFTLTGGSNGDTLDYSVQWAESAGASSGISLTSGSALTGRSATSASATCNGGANLNATVIVDVAESELATATADDYSGTLTLTVEPE